MLSPAHEDCTVGGQAKCPRAQQPTCIMHSCSAVLQKALKAASGPWCLGCKPAGGACACAASGASAPAGCLVPACSETQTKMLLQSQAALLRQSGHCTGERTGGCTRGPGRLRSAWTGTQSLTESSERGSPGRPRPLPRAPARQSGGWSASAHSCAAQALVKGPAPMAAHRCLRVSPLSPGPSVSCRKPACWTKESMLGWMRQRAAQDRRPHSPAPQAAPHPWCTSGPLIAYVYVQQLQALCVSVLCACILWGGKGQFHGSAGQQAVHAPGVTHMGHRAGPALYKLCNLALGSIILPVRVGGG